VGAGGTEIAVVVFHRATGVDGGSRYGSVPVAWHGRQVCTGAAPSDASSLPDRLVTVEPRGRRHAPRVLHGAVRDVVLST
jgi:hypothetical protein